MLAFLVVVFTSASGLLLTWSLTGGFTPGGGRPIVSALVGIVIALLWSRQYSTLSRAYLRGHFDRVRRRLTFWKHSIGRVEAALLRLWMAVEERDDTAREEELARARSLRLLPFARHWARGQQARTNRDEAEALHCFREGRERVSAGLDRAELSCEIALSRLRLALAAKPDSEERRSHLRPAVAAVNEAGDLLRKGVEGAGGTGRVRYVEIFQDALRGLVLMAQNRHPERAHKHLTDALERSRTRAPSVRARRLGQTFRIERLRLMPVVKGRVAAREERDKLDSAVALPEHRQRLVEVEAAMEADEQRREGEEEAEEEAAGLDRADAATAGAVSEEVDERDDDADDDFEFGDTDQLRGFGEAPAGT